MHNATKTLVRSNGLPHCAEVLALRILETVLQFIATVGADD
jgi:hypothetical protein